MNEKWSDFEKFVFKELKDISKRLSKLEGKSALFGGIAGLVATVLGEAVIKSFFK